MLNMMSFGNKTSVQCKNDTSPSTTDQGDDAGAWGAADNRFRVRSDDSTGPRARALLRKKVRPSRYYLSASPASMDMILGGFDIYYCSTFTWYQ